MITLREFDVSFFFYRLKTGSRRIINQVENVRLLNYK